MGNLLLQHIQTESYQHSCLLMNKGVSTVCHPESSLHYETTHMLYKAVLTSTHNLYMFWIKIAQNMCIHLEIRVFQLKIGI